MLDRQRHEESVAEIREAGARIRFISDGDVSAALFAVSAECRGRLALGDRRHARGGALGCGDQVPRRPVARQVCGRETTTSARPRSTPATTSTKFSTIDDLVSGEDVFFAATGVTDGELLQGVRYVRGKANTESLVMRSRSGTVRTVTGRHDQAKLREVTGGRYG